MAERPLLILPEPTQASRGNKGGGGSGPKPLTPGRQKERIGPRLTELEAAFEAKRLVLQTTAAGLVPEDVLVLETAGTIDEFFRAVSRVDGLEFLAEFDEDDIPPDDDFFDEKKSGEREQYRGRVYLMFASQKAFRQLLALWTRWQSGQQMERGLTRWRDVFGLLRDIRPWSARDRLEETGVLDDWRERLEFDQTELPCEVELWYRENAELRARASRHVRSLVQALGGDVLSEAEVGAIHYHALAIRLPLTAVERLLDEDQRGNVSLVQAEQIQFFRASGQMAARVTRDAVVPLLAVRALPRAGAGAQALDAGVI